jgi:translocation and assembly module TamA
MAIQFPRWRKLYLLGLLVGLCPGPRAAWADPPKPSEVVITLEGLDEEIANKVRASLGLEGQKNNPRRSETRIKSLHRAAPEEIREALPALGYYRPEIKEELQPAGGKWFASYRINPGPPILLREFQVTLSGEGRDDKHFQEALTSFPLKQGDALRHDLYEQCKKRLTQVAAEHGYFAAKFRRHEVQVDLNAYQARGWLHFDTGPRYRFGKIQFPKTKVTPEALRLLAPFEEGEPFSQSKLLAFQDILTSTGYFSSVEVSSRRGAAVDQQVPIQVQVAENKRHRYAAGLGFSTDTGPRISADWETRYINEHGHRMNAQLKLSPVLSIVTGRYLIPSFGGDRDAQLEFSANALRRDTDTSKSLTGQIGVGYTTLLWLEPDPLAQLSPRQIRRRRHLQHHPVAHCRGELAQTGHRRPAVHPQRLEGEHRPPGRP